VSAGQTEFRTGAGVVRGRVEGGLRVFRGVPFAKPPVGPLRFRPPEPPDPWEGVRDAIAFAPASMQPAHAGPIAGMSRAPSSEDSLYLNVWAPLTPGPHPVFVWIHGGREFVGGTDDPLYDGSALAARGIVVVTVAYRLGVFGFLALDHLLGAAYAGSANNAVRDQVAALRWVRDEIAGFGGDPARVTVAGQSSGGLNAATLLGIEDARGLFRAAILESSFGGRPAYARAQAQAVTTHLLEELGIAPADAAALHQLPAAELLEAQAAVLARNPFPFRPVIDGTVLARSGADAVRKGLARDVSILIGTNLNEYDLFARSHPLRADPTAALMVNVDSDRVAEEIDAAYRRRFPDLSDDDRRRRLMTAEEHWVPSIRLAEAQAAAGGPAWMYRFEWSPADAARRGLRASHLMELPFVFGTYDAVPQGGLTGTTPDRAPLSRAMGDAWARFVADRDPGWAPFGPAERATMIFDRDSGVRSDPDADERRLWDGRLI
jgi:para-nitrobenzyl esterase